LFSIVALNGLGIGTSSFDEFVYDLNEMEEGEEKEERLDQVEKIYSKMNEVSGEFVVCDGSGLFRYGSMLNHSCSPNAMVTYPFNDNSFCLIATRDIKVFERKKKKKTKPIISNMRYTERGRDMYSIYRHRKRI